MTSPGTIKKLGMDYVHLMLPMEFEPERRCSTQIGFIDPREAEGDLLDPVRFPRNAVEKLKKARGDYAYAGHYQQRPVPREGGMFKREWFTGKVIRQGRHRQSRRRCQFERQSLGYVRPRYEHGHHFLLSLLTQSRLSTKVYHRCKTEVGGIPAF